mgnify:CR=1 FL=1
MNACKNNHVETVKYLMTIDRINVNLVNNDGWSGFYLACGEGNKEIVQILLDDPRVDLMLSDKIFN